VRRVVGRKGITSGHGAKLTALADVVAVDQATRKDPGLEKTDCAGRLAGRAGDRPFSKNTEKNLKRKRLRTVRKKRKGFGKKTLPRTKARGPDRITRVWR